MESLRNKGDWQHNDAGSYNAPELMKLYVNVVMHYQYIAQKMRTGVIGVGCQRN